MSKQPNPKTTKLPTETKAGTKTDLLMVMLASHPGLADKLIEALETDRFFITISCQKKKSPADPNDLHHFWIQQKYPPNDVLLSLRHIANDYKAKECPTAEIEGNGWV